MRIRSGAGRLLLQDCEKNFSRAAANFGPCPSDVRLAKGPLDLSSDKPDRPGLTVQEPLW